MLIKLAIPFNSLDFSYSLCMILLMTASDSVVQPEQMTPLVPDAEVASDSPHNGCFLKWCTDILNEKSNLHQRLVEKVRELKQLVDQSGVSDSLHFNVDFFCR